METKRILLVEDHENDERMAIRTIRQSELPVETIVARDGEIACNLLSESNLNLSLVLLDIKLPKRDGFEVLKLIRSQPQTKMVPVIMLTSSNEPKDIARAYELGANSFIQKQFDPELSDSSLKLALYYWLAVDVASNPSIRSFAHTQSFAVSR